MLATEGPVEFNCSARVKATAEFPDGVRLTKQDPPNLLTLPDPHDHPEIHR
jgi:hypothetical protein